MEQTPGPFFEPPPESVVWRRPAPRPQIRAPIPVEYRQPFEPALYESASRRSAMPDPESAEGMDRARKTQQVQGAGYAGRHRATEYVPGHLAPDIFPYVGLHRLVDRRPEYVPPSAWILMTEVQRRRRVPAWWLVPPAAPAAGPVVQPARLASVAGLPPKSSPEPLPVPALISPREPTPVFDSVAASFARAKPPPVPTPPPEPAPKPRSGPGSRPPRPAPKPSQPPSRPLPPSVRLRQSAPAAAPPAGADFRTGPAPKERGSPGGAGHASGAAAAGWLAAKGYRLRGWFNDPEKGGRRKLLAGTLALAAAAAGVYFAARYGYHYLAAGQGPSAPGTAPASPSHQTLPPAATITLTPQADTVWEGVMNYAHSQGVDLGPDQEVFKQHIVGEVLYDNGQTWPSARHLPEGWQFVITPQRAQEILDAR